MHPPPDANDDAPELQEEGVSLLDGRYFGSAGDGLVRRDLRFSSAGWTSQLEHGYNHDATAKNPNEDSLQLAPLILDFDLSFFKTSRSAVRRCDRCGPCSRPVAQSRSHTTGSPTRNPGSGWKRVALGAPVSAVRSFATPKTPLSPGGDAGRCGGDVVSFTSFS